MILPIDTLVPIISGFWAGVLSNAIFYPLDTIENRQQIDGQLRNKSLKESFDFIYKKDGIYGFFIGWEVGLLGVGFNWAVYFLFFSCFDGFFPVASSLANDLLRGILAGIITSIIINPFWVVKALVIHEYCHRDELTTKKLSILHMIKKVYRFHGLLGFYAGVYPSMWGCSQSAIQFMLYPHIKTSNILSAHLTSESIISFLAGAIAGLVATVLTYPYLTIRTKCQVSKGHSNEKTILHQILLLCT